MNKGPSMWIRPVIMACICVFKYLLLVFLSLVGLSVIIGFDQPFTKKDKWLNAIDF